MASDTFKDDNSSETSSTNTETRLALRVEKETKPVLHLVKLLKEMDVDAHHDNNNLTSKNEAIASLISELEEEAITIERRIVHPALCNGEENENDMMRLGEELPRDWVALEDPESGDIYYSNEVRMLLIFCVAIG